MSRSSTTTSALWATPTHRRPMHPGEMLDEEFLKPLGISQTGFAARLGISRIRLNELVSGKRGITMDTAMRLARVLGTTPDLWLNLQQTWDLWQFAQSSDVAEIQKLQPQRRGMRVSRRPAAG